MDYDKFLAHHEVQLAFSGVPSHFWPSLFRKLDQEVFDAGNYFTMMKEIVENDHIDEKNDQMKVFCNINVSVSDPNCIFLIDHAWTYELTDAKEMLTRNVNLLNRMCSLMEIIVDESDSVEDIVKQVLDKMWLYNQTYSIQKLEIGVERTVPVWYIMDEFGSSIKHSEGPNFRLVPFYFGFQGISYSLLFPIKDAHAGDEVTRDFIFGCQNEQLRQFLLLPWFQKTFTHLPWRFVEPNDEFFQTRLDVDVTSNQPSWKLSAKPKLPLKVYMDNEKLRNSLTDPSFHVVTSLELATVLWFDTHFDEFNTIFESNRNIFINQFPYEELLTAKDLLATIVRSAYANEPPNLDMVTEPKWLASTFNLQTEMPEFVSYFQNREKLGLDNTWIVKPWNLARGMDTCVTNNLSKIIRLIDSGKKIACKYIEHPLLFLRDDTNELVKFDMRFIVMLKSTSPLQLFVYNRFWLRFALKSFSLTELDDYEKHFTVFNYLDSDKIKQMFCDDFVKQFSLQYPDQDWRHVEKRLHETIKETFSIACRNKPPKGFGDYPQCRAMYGIDMMLKWDTNDKGERYLQPILLEVNFMPDCVRACNYYPDFVNTVFRTLFLDEKPEENLPVTLL